jgi:UPF0755 protein
VADEPAEEPVPEATNAGRSFARRHVLALVNSGIVVVVLIVLGAGWLWYRHAEAGAPGKGVVITVSEGESFDAVRSELISQGVIGSGLAFDLYALLNGTPTVVPGQYYMQKDESFADTASVLGAAPNVLSLQVPPGFTVAEISARIEAGGYTDLGNAFEQAATSGTIRSPFQPAGSKNLDGLLAAGSYEVLPNESARSLLTEMIDQFTKIAATSGISPSDELNGLDAYEVVTVASIVEKEGYIEKNMGRVSRVIYNRLAAGMPLQMDSTVLYSLGQDGGPVTPADLRIRSPYNTYLNTGLTPTPICFPSVQALAAATHPTPGAWLYFTLVSEDGTEAFSDTYAGQLANEKLARERGIS